MLSAAAFMTAVLTFTWFMISSSDENLKFMIDALRGELVQLIKTVERHECVLYPAVCWPEGR